MGATVFATAFLSPVSDVLRFSRYRSSKNIKYRSFPHNILRYSIYTLILSKIKSDTYSNSVTRSL